nr:peptidyl-prolyl cis-trans isomerase sig-7 [Vanessa tameamea]
MAVVIETTLGDITVDLYLDQRPVTCLNFLKLCKMKYYNYNLFHTIRSGFIAQTGDPSGEGSGGQSIWGILEGPQKRFFSGEKMPKIRHTGAGLLSMVGTDDMMIGSQFFITLAPDLDSLDGTHCVIGEVTEGHEVLTKLNEVICDESHRPYRDVRITHTVVLEDPFNDPSGLRAPSRSPSPSAERLKGGRIAPDEEIDETQGKSAEEIQEMIEEKEAKARATILEIVGDLPDAEIAPPENVLFVCKLNPVTTDEDLEIIFSRFGTIVSCEVIRDKKTGNSLQYAFIEFENKKSCEDAYFKMDNVLIDDRRIHVDFSQSVSKMRWLGKGRGVQYFDDDTNMPQPKDEVKHRERHTDKRYRIEDHAIQERHHDKRENKRDRDGRYGRDRNNHKQHRDRSRSRSRQEYSRDRASERGNDRYSKENAQIRDNKYRDSNKYDNHKNNHSSSHKSRFSSNYNDRRESSKSPRRYNDKSDYRKHNDKKYDKNSTSSHNSHRMEPKHRHSNNEEKHKQPNREYRDEKNKVDNDQSKTPSPAVKNKKDNKNDKKVIKKHSTKKRKHSTSSSDSSETSSSSSESSSSSDNDKKKKKLKKKKRKRSTSSSSSETSSNSSSSSSSDSSDTSSSSDSKHSKKKRKNNTKKTGRKTKKKL